MKYIQDSYYEDEYYEYYHNYDKGFLDHHRLDKSAIGVKNTGVLSFSSLIMIYMVYSVLGILIIAAFSAAAAAKRRKDEMIDEYIAEDYEDGIKEEDEEDKDEEKDKIDDKTEYEDVESQSGSIPFEGEDDDVPKGEKPPTALRCQFASAGVVIGDLSRGAWCREPTD